MPTSATVIVESLSAASFEPYGWVFGQPDPATSNPVGFYSPASDFWHEHGFDPGAGGDTEVLWVTYRNASPQVARLEVHHLTQQAVVPLTGDIIQILCLSDAGGKPDLTTLRAFSLSPGIGLCMRPGIWHTTRAENATCLMLTRGSTTKDLVDHLLNKEEAMESASADITPIELSRA